VIGLIQRVSQASVSVDGETIGKINQGILILLGVEKPDTEDNAKKLLNKIINYRIFEDEDRKSSQEELKTFLEGKRALFIGRDKHDTKRAQYVFETYGIHIDNIKLDDFEKKRPDLQQYDMAIIRSTDLSYKHVSFFKNIYQDEKSNFKIIIVHELFEDEEKIEFSKSIAHAELYSPIIIGDVEEILYQMYILKSKAVKGINNMEVFDPNSFTIKGKSTVKDSEVDWFKGAHIAVVEDSKVDQRVLKNILDLDGVMLFLLGDGSEMLELLEREEIDIIFSDIHMPIMDGLQMTKLIRAKKKWEHIPVISISSMAFPHEVEEMKIAGMNASIAKPIEAEDVYMALEKFLVITAKIRNREVDKYKIEFLYDKNVLDIEKGVKKEGSKIRYLEKLIETMEVVKKEKEEFKNFIDEQKYIALKKLVRTALFMYEDIYATEMIEMFKPYILPHKHPRVDSKMKPDVWFQPAIVAEIIGAELTLSPLHTCCYNWARQGVGISIRFPRFIRWRPDKGPEDVTTTKELFEMYKRQLRKISEQTTPV